MAQSCDGEVGQDLAISQEINPTTAASDTEEYFHEPLSDKTRQIRLVKIVPSDNEDGIPSCRLTTEYLDQAPEYFALSYACGDPHDLVPCRVDNKTFKIYRNLAGALRHLPGVCGPDALYWIDCLSIDQRNDDEKSAQVILMSKIFKTASFVPVWLGEETKSTRAVFTVLKSMAEHCSALWDFIKMASTLEDEVWLQRTSYWRGKLFALLCVDDKGFARLPLRQQQLTPFHIETLLGAAIFEEILQLIERPWWGRLWVRQELVLAKVCAFVCGSKTLKADILLLGLQAFSVYILISPGGVRFVANSRLGSDKLSNINNLGMAREAGLAQRAETYSSLLYHVQKGRGADSSLAQDRIFANLGMSDEVLVTKNPPDYNMSVQDVYARFFQTWVETYQNLDIMMYSAVDGAISSWIPDWQTRTVEHAIVKACLRHMHTFRPGGSVAPQCVFPDRPLQMDRARLLAVAGFEFDTIKAVESGLSIEEHVSLYKHMHMPTSERLSGRKRMAANLGADWEVSFWLTHSLGIGSNGQRLNVREMADLETTVRNWLAGPSQDAWPDGRFGELVSPAVRARFFTTSSGRFGIYCGQKYMEQHDCICVLFGASLPLLIRPGDGDGQDSLGRLVGPCYIRGVMDGELMAGYEDGTYPRKIFKLE